MSHHGDCTIRVSTISYIIRCVWLLHYDSLAVIPRVHNIEREGNTDSFTTIKGSSCDG